MTASLLDRHVCPRGPMNHSENTRWHLAVRYGSRALELSRGKSAIDVAELADLVPVLTTIRTAQRRASRTICYAQTEFRRG